MLSCLIPGVREDIWKKKGLLKASLLIALTLWHYV